MIMDPKRVTPREVEIVRPDYQPSKTEPDCCKKFGIL